MSVFFLRHFCHEVLVCNIFLPRSLETIRQYFISHILVDDKHVEFHRCCLWCHCFGPVFKNVQIATAQEIGQRKTPAHTHQHLTRDIVLRKRKWYYIFCFGRSIIWRLTKDCHLTFATANTYSRLAVLPSQVQTFLYDISPKKTTMMTWNFWSMFTFRQSYWNRMDLSQSPHISYSFAVEHQTSFDWL